MQAVVEKEQELDRLREQRLKGELSAEDYVRMSIELINGSNAVRHQDTDDRRAKQRTRAAVG